MQRIIKFKDSFFKKLNYPKPHKEDEKPRHSLSHRKNKRQKEASCNQIIKAVWTHEPWLYFKVIVKSVEVMGEYIALHGLVPQNELPFHLRRKIPENEIWMREDIYNDLQERKRILSHEYAELDLMITHSMTYKEAHRRAEYFEHFYYL